MIFYLQFHIQSNAQYTYPKVQYLFIRKLVCAENSSLYDCTFGNVSSGGKDQLASKRCSDEVWITAMVTNWKYEAQFLTLYQSNGPIGRKSNI